MENNMIRCLFWIHCSEDSTKGKTGWDESSGDGGRYNNSGVQKRDDAGVRV